MARALSALRGELVALGQLGLTPPTRAQLAQTVASTEGALDDLFAQGAEIIANVEARHAAEAAQLPATATERDGGTDDGDL